MDFFSWSKREKILGGCIAVLLMLLAVSLLHPVAESAQRDALDWKKVVKEKAPESPGSEQNGKTEQAKFVVVDVKGAVRSPGVYEMETEDRVMDVIRKAGGFSDDADEKRINLAKRLEDEMVIYVPKKGEERGKWTDIAAGGNEDQEKINVNGASADELERLPGIGPVKAKAIVSYREKHGPFKKPEDLLNVSGIGEKSLEQMKSKIRLH